MEISVYFWSSGRQRPQSCLKANPQLSIRELDGGPPRYLPRTLPLQNNHRQKPRKFSTKKDSQNVTNLRLLQTGNRKNQVFPESKSYILLINISISQHLDPEPQRSWDRFNEAHIHEIKNYKNLKLGVRQGPLFPRSLTLPANLVH